jgi:hypothetical protein
MNELSNPLANQRLFIVGLPRAGTSTLVHALRAVGFRGFAEGHLLGLLPVVEETIVRYYETWKGDNLPDTMLNKMDLYELMLRYRSFFRETFDQLIGQPPWLDKNASPFIMPYLKLIQSVWSDAAFIFTKRRPVDFIISAMKKFPDRSFEHFCEVIHFTFDNWERQKGALKSYIEVDQSELCDPARLSDKLIEFLKIDPSKKSIIISRLNDQVERTSETYTARSLSELNLSAEQLALFNEKCSSVMHQYDTALPSEHR